MSPKRACEMGTLDWLKLRSVSGPTQCPDCKLFGCDPLAPLRSVRGFFVCQASGIRRAYAGVRHDVSRRTLPQPGKKELVAEGQNDGA